MPPARLRKSRAAGFIDKPAIRKTLATVNFENRAELEAILEGELNGSEERIHTAVKKLRAAGIIDGRGNRRNKKLPPDMRPGSRCQLPG
jgi:hypothetical protein